MAAPGSLGLLHAPSFTAAKCQPVASRAGARRAPRPLFAVRASAADAANKDAVLRAFRENRALKVYLSMCLLHLINLLMSTFTFHLEHEFQLFSNKIFMKCVRSKHDIRASFTCYFQSFSALEICRFTAVFRLDSWSIWPPKFIWLDGFSSQNADNHRLMQIISGLQNFDRSSVASVVTAADKVLTMHLSLNVYYFVLKCIAVLLLYFKKNYFALTDFFETE